MQSDSIRTLDRSLEMRNKQQAWLAARRAGASVAAACRVAKLPRQTYLAWLSRNPEFRAEAEQIDEERTDKLEQIAEQVAAAGDTQMLKFMLSARRKRYAPRVSHDVDMSVEINVVKKFDAIDGEAQRVEGGPSSQGVPPDPGDSGFESGPA